MIVYSGYGQEDGPDLSPVETYVPDPSEFSPSMVAGAQPSNGHGLAVVGVTLAFFSTLMFVTNLLMAGGRIK